MNARSQVFDFVSLLVCEDQVYSSGSNWLLELILMEMQFQTTECHQVSEVVSCIFHSILFHRTLGKFHYRQEGKYSIGTIGYEDIDCDFIDLTYVS